MYDVNSRDHSLKDPAEFVECVLCITTQSRGILRRILPDIDGSLCNGRLCPAACIDFDGHGDVRCKAFGVVDFIFLVLRHIVIVAVLMVGGTDALCTVIHLILQIAEGECAGGEFVLVCCCLTCDEGALQIGIPSDQEIKAAGSCEDARLVSCTPVVGVNISLVPRYADDNLSRAA